MMLLISFLIFLLLVSSLAWDIFARTRRTPRDIIVVRGISFDPEGLNECDHMTDYVQRAYRSARRPAPPVIFVSDDVEMTIVRPDQPPHRVISRR